MSQHRSTRSPDDGTTATGVAQRGLIYGSFALLFSLPGVILAVPAIPSELLVSRWGIPLLQVDLSVQWLPSPTDGGFDFAEWRTSLLRDLAVLVFLIWYYGALLVSLIGGVLILTSAALLRGPEKVVSGFRETVRLRPVQGILGVYAIVALAVYVPVLFRLFVELAVALAVGGTVVAVFGGAWLRLRERGGPVVRVALLYPLALGTIFLPVIATGLASPTFGPFLQRASTEVAIVLLDTVLAVGGFSDWLRATFQLTGINYFLMWLGVVFVAGWIVGIVAERAIESRQGARTHGG